VKTVPELPHQPRLHSLADLERAIVEAENARDRRREVLRRVTIGQDPGAVRMLLDLAEEQVARLHRSREVLLRGAQSPHVEDEADAP
jgi:hypothetical protein